MAWAPLVQASTETLILPTYGIDINPFLFLLTDLRFRYESEWFKVANNRERRWVAEMERLFREPRWLARGGSLRLREDGRDLTDIDFAAYDTEANELALFQLKWQQPVGLDNRGRRSAGKNLLQESNRWIATVFSWLEQHGVGELMGRLGCSYPCSPRVRLFVLGRYYAHLSGFHDRDDRAVWSDWAHFHRTCIQGKNVLSVAELWSRLHAAVESSRARKSGESTMYPVGDVAVLVNPTSVPEDRK
jgi:hypothetical protein